MKRDVTDAIGREKIIVIVRGVRREDLVPLADALCGGGIRLMELAFDNAGNKKDEAVAEEIAMLADKFRGKMFIGAGTVLTEKQVSLTAKAGGSFIVAPNVCPEVIKKATSLGLAAVPGAFTPTEIQAAHEAGADFVKLFPAKRWGAENLKLIKAPLAHVKLLAVGDIGEEDIEPYLKAGADGFCIGSAIADKKKIAAGDFAGIRDTAKRFTKTITNQSR